MEDVTLDELRGRYGDGSLAVLDVRTPYEYDGSAGAHCDPRQGTSPARGTSRSRASSLPHRG